MKDFIDNLPYLRYISDRSQISAVMYQYRGLLASKRAFKALSKEQRVFIPKEWHSFKKSYYDALEIVLQDEINEEIRTKERALLTDDGSIENILQTCIPSYWKHQYGTVSFWYDIDVSNKLAFHDNDISQSIWQRALEHSIELIVNVLARIYLADALLVKCNTNDEKLKQINETLLIASEFDYITPTKQRSILNGGAVTHDIRTF